MRNMFDVSDVISHRNLTPTEDDRKLYRFDSIHVECMIPAPNRRMDHAPINTLGTSHWT